MQLVQHCEAPSGSQYAFPLEILPLHNPGQQHTPGQPPVVGVGDVVVPQQVQALGFPHESAYVPGLKQVAQGAHVQPGIGVFVGLSVLVGKGGEVGSRYADA